MATLFQKLGYNYSDPHGDIAEFSANTKAHLDAIPSLIEDWQTQDISDSNVSGYNQNPLGTISTTIAVTANLIMNLKSTIEIYDNVGVPTYPRFPASFRETSLAGQAAGRRRVDTQQRWLLCRRALRPRRSVGRAPTTGGSPRPQSRHSLRLNGGQRRS